MTTERPPSIGRTLRWARKALGWGLEEVASRIHVKPAYLQALEEERWEDLPSFTHAKGFLRLYAETLGLDPEPLIRALEGDESPVEEPEVPSTPDAVSPTYRVAQERLQALGEALREQRERLGFSLEQAAQQIHVAEKYLEALERGDLDAFPSSIQARGMLALYARFLHMDVDEVLLRFAEALQYRMARPAEKTPHGPARWHRWVAWMGFLLYALLALGVAAILGWGGYLVWQATAQEAHPTPTPPPVNTRPPVAAPALTAQAVATSLAQGTRQPTPVGTDALENLQVTPSPEEPLEQAPVYVVVEARYRVWLRVVSDGKPVFQGRLRPGEQRTFRAEKRMELLVGNGGALRVAYNQQDLGLLGDWGQVVSVVFTPEHVLTPTPTPTLTPTPTNTPTITPTPTATPTPFPTVGP